jgi:hypothetical protein
VDEVVFPPVRKGEFDTAFLSRTLKDPELLRALSVGGLSNFARMDPNGLPPSTVDEAADSLDRVAVMPTLAATEAEVA